MAGFNKTGHIDIKNKEFFMAEEESNQVYLINGNVIKYKGDIIYHPGHYVKDWVKDSGYNEKAIACAMNIDEIELKKLERGITDLDDGLTEKLEEVTGITKSLWKRFQDEYDRQIKDLLMKRRKECRFIAIDASTKKTALSFFVNGELKAVKLIDCSIIGNEEERVELMSRLLFRWLEKAQPMIVYIEDTVVTRDAKTQRLLTRIQGVVYTYCILHECEFNTVLPTVWRKYAGLNQSKGVARKDLKRQAVKTVNERYGLDVSDDEAESVLIGDGVLKMFDKWKGKEEWAIL